MDERARRRAAEIKPHPETKDERRTVRVELKEREGRSNNLISLPPRGCNSEVLGGKKKP